ncbi:enoyl-CoA hydratase/isomerase family protein [soil metagenome]
MITIEKYQHAYKNVAFERRDGILEIRLHNDGGVAMWGGGLDDLHAELSEAFYFVGRDPENKMVIITGTGDQFLIDNKPTDPAIINTLWWDRIYKEGKDLITNLLEIEVPVIAAANGPAHIHAELLLLSDIVIASDQVSFADQHAMYGLVPGDGCHVFWEMLLGMNRSRHFLLTGRTIDAQESKDLGLVAELVPHGTALDRAWEVARDLVSTKPPLMLRYSRVALTQNIKRRMLNDLGYGLIVEGMAALSAVGK